MNDEESLETEILNNNESNGAEIEPVSIINFQKLTPEKSLGETGLSGYKEALDYAFLDEDIANIALTGAYGSGKSSIIESYKKKSNLNFLHISLAHFDKRETDNSVGNDDINERNLEGKILNQLLHQIDSREIPQTIFRTKKKVKKKSILFITCLFLSTIVSILYLLNVVPWVNYLKVIFLDIYKIQPFFSVPSKNTMDKLAIMIILSSSFYLIFKLIITQLNRKIFKGFSFKSTGVESDVEIFAETDASYFDKFLDDVLYLFVQSKADIIVFEDIDRFENEGIFEKLKEINTLVNNKLSSNKILFGANRFNKKKKKLRFIYLLKDDLFLSKDRTKFFDFIIPVVPVITSTNSYEKLRDLLTAGAMYEKFDRNFLQKISLYIDDMRLMKNIYNEFLIYFRRIDIVKLNLSNDELFALITYKNIFPKDFSDLLFNRGFVYNLFEGKENYISTHESDISDEIKSLETRVNNAEKEQFSSIDELMSLYIPYTIRIGYYKHKEHFPSGGAFISEMRDTQETLYYLYDRSNWTTITFEEIEDKVGENQDFLNRKKMLTDKKRKEKIKEKISHLRNELNLVKTSKLKEVISKKEIVDLAKEKYQNIETNEYFELIVFLIRNGYINEGYSDYITYFYDNSLRINDKNFLRSISDEKALDWNFALTELMDVKEEVLDRMNVADFSKIESLNFNLLEYMVLTQSNPLIVNYLKVYFGMIKKYEKFQFIIEAFLYYSSFAQKELILSILKYDSSLFEYIFLSNRFSDEQLSKFTVFILSNLDSSQFMSGGLAGSQQLRKIISNSTNFLFESTDFNEYFVDNLKMLSPLFKSVSFSEIDVTVAEAIFKNNLYEINFDNLYSALNHFFNIDDEEKIKHENYSIICNIDDRTLLDYVENEIDNYVAQYVNFSKDKISDDLESIYRLINNENLSFEESDRYLSCLELNDLELNRIKNENKYLTIIKYRKARANEMNILTYFISKENEWTNDLIEFIKDENAGYSFDEIKANELLGNGKAEGFFSKTANNINIPNKQYKDIMEKINKVLTSFTNGGLSHEKIEILVEYDKISLSETSLNTFRTDYSEHLIKFILQNINKYVELVRSVDLKEEENEVYYKELYDVLYKSQYLSIELQKKIVDCFEVDEKISINNDYFNDELKAYILDTRFDINDLEYVFEVYDTQPDIIKIEIYKQLKINQLLIIEKKIAISKNLLYELLNDDNVQLDDKQLLMSRNIKNIEINKLIEIFTGLNLQRFPTLFDNKEPTFDINETNENILTYLDRINVISSFKEDDGKYKAYNRSRRNKRFEFLD